MTKAKIEEAKSLFSLTSNRLEAAETAFGAALRRLSALDAEIAALVIDRARTADEGSLAAVELVRRMAALRIDEMRRERRALETESEALREETRQLLRQKIALEGELAALEEEASRRTRNRA
jgi:chromosome segregation ATPase